jgi:hypothetical protein
VKRPANGSRKKGLLALDHAVKQRCVSTARVSPPERALAAAPVRVKPRKTERLRGIRALLAADAPTRRSTQRRPRMEHRAYDVGGPIRARLTPAEVPWSEPPSAHALAFAAPVAAWPWLASDDEAPGATTAFTVEAFEASPQSGVTGAERESQPAPAPEELPTTVLAPDPELPTALSSDTDQETAEFARQIQALLSGATPAPEPAKAPPTESPSPPPLPGQASAHDVFAKMGRNMAYATEFRLPAMELGKRFDAIESEIAGDEARKAARDADERSFELTDEEIREGLHLPPLRKPPPVALPEPNVAPTPTAVPFPPPQPSPTGPEPVQNGSPAA